MSDEKIDKQICGKTGNRGNADYGEAAGSYKENVCNMTGGQTVGSGEKGLYAFTSKSITGKGLNWPNSADGSKNNNSELVSKDIMDLNKDEKAVVAGHLAKSIEGGEVVEIRSVSSTSVMVEVT